MTKKMDISPTNDNSKKRLNESVSAKDKLIYEQGDSDRGTDIISLNAIADTTESYKNELIARANDHDIRMSVMTEAYFWHYHPNSDEVFIVLSGILVIELQDRVIELEPHSVFTVKKGTIHRTRPKSVRTVNLTFSSRSIQTKKV